MSQSAQVAIADDEHVILFLCRESAIFEGLTQLRQRDSLIILVSGIALHCFYTPAPWGLFYKALFGNSYLYIGRMRAKLYRVGRRGKLCTHPALVPKYKALI